MINVIYIFIFIKMLYTVISEKPGVIKKIFRNIIYHNCYYLKPFEIFEHSIIHMDDAITKAETLKELKNAVIKFKHWKNEYKTFYLNRIVIKDNEMIFYSEEKPDEIVDLIKLGLYGVFYDNDIKIDY